MYTSNKEQALNALNKAAEIRAEIFGIKHVLAYRSLLYFPYRHWLKIAKKFNTKCKH